MAAAGFSARCTISGTVTSPRGSRPLAALPAASRLAVLLLSGFHAWLFWTHLASGRLAEPAVASRWGIGLLLAAAFFALRGASIPLTRGRRALVLWVLVAFLHAHAVLSPRGALSDPPALDEAVAAFVLQAASTATLLCAGLVFLGIALALRARGNPRPVWAGAPPVDRRRDADGWRLLLAPRPPPRS